VRRRDRPVGTFLRGTVFEPRSSALRAMLVLGYDLGRSSDGVHIKAVWPSQLPVDELVRIRDALIAIARGETD
jgi:hypothetical protein